MNDAQTDTPTVLNDDGRSIAERILDEMPTPQENAIAARSDEFQFQGAPESAASAPSGTATSSEVDAAGAPWNPEIHATGSDGKGVRTAKGLWRQRRGKAGSRASVVGAPQGAASPTIAQDTKARAAGVACAHSLFMMGRMIGGEEWAPRVITQDGKILLNEQAMMEQAWGDYFVATGKTDFPPWMGLTMACSAYALPRFTMPVTQSRIQKAKEWIVQKYVAYKMRKANRAKATAETTIDGVQENATDKRRNRPNRGFFRNDDSPNA